MTTVRPVEVLRLHPDAERVPLADSADLAALRASLRENGQQDPIDVTPDDVILDGRTRWTLLKELGAQTVQVRVVNLPAEAQRSYIVDRALARRHLTNEQKRALNALLREVVVEERPTRRGNPMRIGHSQTERATTLGVDRSTVAEWDREPLVVGNPTTSPPPTHAIDKRGRPQPLHKDQPPRSTERPRIRPVPKRTGPPWQRHFTLWCRAVLPEDRATLRQMSIELHKALGLLGITCEGIDGDSQTRAS